MSKSFAESYLIDMLGSRLMLEPAHDMEISRGIELALQEFRRTPHLPLEKLAEAVERIGTGEATATVNLLGMPLGYLWVRAALLGARQKLAGQPQARVVIIGLWQVLKGAAGRRTDKVEAKFTEWKNFVEEQLLGANIKELSILWIG